MKLEPALRDAALFVPFLVVLTLLIGYAQSQWPSPTVWLITIGVALVRFVLVATGALGSRPRNL